MKGAKDEVNLKYDDWVNRVNLGKYGRLGLQQATACISCRKRHTVQLHDNVSAKVYVIPSNMDCNRALLQPSFSHTSVAFLLVCSWGVTKLGTGVKIRPGSMHTCCMMVQQLYNVTAVLSPYKCHVAVRMDLRFPNQMS